MRKGKFLLLAALISVVVVGFALPVGASDHDNHVAIFAGLTHAEGENAFTLGADYERRLPGDASMFGVALLVDATVQEKGDSHKHTIYAGGVMIHPWEGLKLGAFGGVERPDGEGNKGFVRGTVGYDIPMGHMSLTPGVSVDRAGGHTAVVYGVSLGYGF